MHCHCGTNNRGKKTLFGIVPTIGVLFFVESNLLLKRLKKFEQMIIDEQIQVSSLIIKDTVIPRNF